MKVVDFADVRAERNGYISPKLVVEGILENISDVKDIVVTLRTQDGEIIHAISTMNQVNAIGLFELGKALVFNDMRGDGE